MRGGDVFYAELKREGGKPTAKQVLWRDLLLGAGRSGTLVPHDEEEIMARFERTVIERIA